MRARTGRIFSFVMALVMALIMTLSARVALADANVQSLNKGELTKYNVELVIDGSGSLVTGADATDPEGLRYDAINLFLALLTNKGNNVGAIVFDDNSDKFLLDTGLAALDGRDDKIALSKKIKDAGTGNDTDIGSALLRAVNTLAEDGDPEKQSVVILFSDGKTDLGDNEDALKQSLDNKETAIETAQDNGIPVYTICLNAGSGADPEELSEIADRTSGQAVEVAKPDDLADAFEEFYNLIFSTSAADRQDDTFPSDGTLEYDINVPSYGAEEVNLVLRSDQVKDIELTSPSGAWSSSEIDNAIMSGGDIEVLKISDPEAGDWHLTITGNEGDTATVNIIYNIDTEAVLSTPDGNTDYATGDTVTLSAGLTRDGTPVEDSSVTEEYKAVLYIKDNRTGDTENADMEPGSSGTFTYDFKTNAYDSYDIYAVLSYGQVELTTNTLSLNFGNSAPSLTAPEDDKSHTISVLVTPLTGRRKNIDVTKYFSDDQDDTLSYSIVSSQLAGGSMNLDGNTLKVNTAESRSGDVVVRATDSQGAYTDLTLHFKVHNWTLPIIIGFFAIIAAIIVVAILAARAARPLFRGNIYVENLANGMRFPRGSFRGKIKLSSLPIGNTGFDPNSCYFKAERGNTVSFHAKQPFYVNGMKMTDINLFGGWNYIFSDEAMKNGMRIEVRQM